MFVFVKFLKRHFKRVSFNDKHGNRSLLNDCNLFSELKNDIVIGPDKKRNTVCKNALIVAINDL